MPKRRLFQDELADRVVNDSDVIEATRMWAMGLLSGQELIDRLESAKQTLDSYPVEYEHEPVEVA